MRNDKLRLTTLKMAVPAGVKFVSKNVEDAIDALNSGKTDKYKMLVVVDSVVDALRIAEGSSVVESVNLGNMKNLEGRRQLTPSVYASDEEIAAIKELLARGVEVGCQAVPTEAKVPVEMLI